MTLAAGALIRTDWPTPGQIVRSVALPNTNLTSGATVTVTLWLNPAAPVAVATKTVAGPVPGYGQVIIVFPSDYTCDFVQVTFNDPTNPDNHINVGGLFIGPLWIPATGLSWDTTLGRNVRRVDTVSRGGQVWSQFQSVQRRRSFTLGNLRGAELWAQQQDLEATAALGGNVLLIPNITSSTLGQEAVYGPLTPAADASMPLHNADRFSWGGTVTQRL